MLSSLHAKVFFGFLLGIALGIGSYTYVQATGDIEAVNFAIDWIAKPAGQLFLNLLFMLVLPLMFSALVLAVSDVSDVAAFGRIGLRTLVNTAVLTAVAIGVGLLAANLLHPGVGFDPAIRDAVMAESAIKAHAIVSADASASGINALVGVVPRNIVHAASTDQFLSVMVFAVLLGIALVLTPTPAAEAFKLAIQGLNELVMKLIGLIVQLAPYAVWCLMYALCARFGWDLLLLLGRFMLTVLLALGVHMFVVLPLWVRFAGRTSPAYFFRGSREAIVLAFSTASSTATLPTTLKVAEHNLGLPPGVARFVVTIGAATNHHGTALFEGLAVLFLVQCFGVTLGLGQQAMLLGLCVLSGMGTATVPAASMPVIAMLLGYVHVPPEGIGLIIGVDRLLDMCRTALNVTGDLATAVVVAHQEAGSRPTVFARVWDSGS